MVIMFLFSMEAEMTIKQPGKRDISTGLKRHHV